MRTQMESAERITRSENRIRESIRSLPKGRFEQCRQMFDQPKLSNKNKSSVIQERTANRSLTTACVFKLPVTDDEKLQHSSVSKSKNENHRDYLNEYDEYRVKSSKQFQNHQTSSLSKPNESLLKASSPMSENAPTTRGMHYPTDSPQKTPKSSSINIRDRLSMTDAINYSDSYQTSTPSHLKRIGNSRQYVSNIQHPVVTAPSQLAIRMSMNQTTGNIFHEIDEIHPYSFQTSKRAQSSTSLSSTGYDSNSSPSMKSTRDSSVTNISHDFIANSVSSSSASSSSSSDEQQQKEKPWTRREASVLRANQSHTNSNNRHAFYGDDVETTTVVSRQQIQLSQNNQLSRHSGSYPRHAAIVNSMLIPASSSTLNTSTSRSTKETTIGQTKSPNSSYVLQTTSFPDDNRDKVDSRLSHLNNTFVDRSNSYDTLNAYQKLHETFSAASTGFQILPASTDRLRSSTFIPIQEIKGHESPLPIAENPLFLSMAPKKPPRTFQQENRYDLLDKVIDQKVPSSDSSPTASPTIDLGNRSVSCMNLTAGTATSFLAERLRPRVNPSPEIPPRPAAFKNREEISTPSESIYETLQTPPTSTRKDLHQRVNFNSPLKATQAISGRNHRAHVHDISLQTPSMKRKGSHVSNLLKPSMKKGVSEPNLAKTSRSKSPASVFFSPRQLFDRFKRILPLTGSRQSLHERDNSNQDNLSASAMADTDDSSSMSSENSYQFQTSRLDHVQRVKSIYNTLQANQMTHLITDLNQMTSSREIKSFYDYVVHLIAENEIGYFSNGNGCLVTARLNSTQTRQANSIRFKYPKNAKDESNLKYFCFPDNREVGQPELSSTHKTVQEFFRFTLTNLHGVRQYGYCSRFIQKGQLNALCLISPYDTVELYERILSTATELILSYKEREAQIFLTEIYSRSLPSPGETIHIGTTTVGLYTLKCEIDRRKLSIDSMTLLNLSTETIIKIFSAILYEQKLIFVSDQLGPLTRLINTFVCLLYPFSWPHTYIPVLPAIMLDVIQAPTPYIIGILRSYESYLYNNDDLLSQDNSDILIVDIDNDSVRSLSTLLRNESTRSPLENFTIHGNHNSTPLSQHILPKTFKIELKQEISVLRKSQSSLSLDECQQRLRQVFMSIFVQSCYNYREYLGDDFDRERFLQSKQHTIALFLEWFTQTQIFHIFIRQKFESTINSNSFAVTFDRACDEYTKHSIKQAQNHVTARALKRKSATRTPKQDNRL